MEPIDQAYNQARAEWVGVLTQLWDAIGKPIDKKRLDVYIKQLANVPMGILEAVVNKMIREHTWATIPTIGEIWHEIRKGYGTDEDLADWTPAAVEHVKGKQHSALELKKSWKAVTQ
jgi:hypothetical protein